MSDVNNFKLLSECTSGVPPVILLCSVILYKRLLYTLKREQLAQKRPHQCSWWWWWWWGWGGVVGKFHLCEVQKKLVVLHGGCGVNLFWSA